MSGETHDRQHAMPARADNQALETLAADRLKNKDFSWDTLAQLTRLLKEGAISKARKGFELGEASKSMMFGAWTHGGMQGVSTNSKNYPGMTKYVNAFLKHHTPKHIYSSFVISINAFAPPHLDPHNSPESLNMSVSYGNFSGGELWIAEEGTPQPQCDPVAVGQWRVRKNDQGVRGHLYDSFEKPVYFSPKLLHATQGWKGERFSLTAFTTRGLPKLDAEQISQLQSLNFPLSKQITTPQQALSATKPKPNRFLVEFCCSPDSKLSQVRAASKGCHCIRVTEDLDGTKPRALKYVADQITLAARDEGGAIAKRPSVLIFASLPCTGGCTWQRINSKTTEGGERVESHKQLFRKLFRSLRKLDGSLCKFCDVSIALELPASCDYWKLPMIQNFIDQHGLQEHLVDGCMVGIKDKEGAPLKKTWRIVSDVSLSEQLSGLRCDKSHQHGESRGNDLKKAESYTYVLTDAVHVSWSKHVNKQVSSISACASLQQVSETSFAGSLTLGRAIAAGNREPSAATAPKLACVNMEVPKFHSNVPQRPLETLSADYPEMGNYWRSQLITAGLAAETNNLGLAEGEGDTLLRMYQEVTPQLLLNGSLESRTASLPALSLLASISNEGLNRAQTVAPDRAEIGERAMILVSDSTLTMVSGSKRAPKHTSPSDTLQAYLTNLVQPGYSEVRMEDRWGGRLIHLVGRVEAIMDELIEATGNRLAAIDVMVVWSGNELVGSRGVFCNPDPYCREVWPNETWDEVHGAQGDIRQIASGIQRALRVLAGIRNRPRSGFVSIVLGNNAPIYYLPKAFDTLNEFFSEEARKMGLHTLDLRQLLDRAEFKDHWHLWHSDKNRALLGSYFAREIQVLLLEATTARYYCSLKRLAERFPFNPDDYFTVWQNADLVGQIHSDQTAGLSAARRKDKTLPPATFISREAANDSLSELNAIEDFYQSRLPTTINVTPLPEHLVRTAEESQPKKKEKKEEPTAGGDPEPGPEEVDTSIRREIDVDFAVDTLGPLPDLGSLPLFEVPPEKWPKVVCRHLRMPELKRFSGIIRGGNRRAVHCLNMDAEGWLLVDDVLQYLNDNSTDKWSLAEIIDAFKFDKKERFAIRGPNIGHSSYLELPVWPFQIRANQGHSQTAVSKNPKLATATAVSFFDPRPRPELEGGGKDYTAARNGKPLEMATEFPTRLYHRTSRASAMAIVEEGFMVGGGPQVESGKAHVYFADRPLEDMQYKLGVRAAAKFEMVVDTEIAMYLGALFFRTTSDGILTTDRVHPRAVLGVRDTTTDETVWSADS